MTAREEAIEAVAKALVRDGEVIRLGEARAAVGAAIPHLLAPIREFAEELKAADDGSLVTSDYAWIGRRLNALLDQIEAEAKR